MKDSSVWTSEYTFGHIIDFLVQSLLPVTTSKGSLTHQLRTTALPHPLVPRAQQTFLNFHLAAPTKSSFVLLFGLFMPVTPADTDWSVHSAHERRNALQSLNEEFSYWIKVGLNRQNSFMTRFSPFLIFFTAKWCMHEQSYLNMVHSTGACNHWLKPFHHYCWQFTQ